LRENASERTARYIEMTVASLERLSVSNLPGTVKESQVQHILDLVRGYVKDAKHYAEKRKPVTSLACVAYAEGLLDTMKLLDLVEF
jgi:FAD synthetase